MENYLISKDSYLKLKSSLLLRYPSGNKATNALILRLFLKSKSLKEFNLKLEKAFSPVSNPTKIENGHKGYATRNRALMDLKNKAYLSLTLNSNAIGMPVSKEQVEEFRQYFETLEKQEVDLITKELYCLLNSLKL